MRTIALLRGSAVVAAGLSLGLAVAADSALAQGGARQVVSFTFDERAPATATGVRLAIDYVNPDDPGAKPYAVQTLVESLAAGARFDTAVPERCGASDAELMSMGPAACPPGSRVGGGELDLDTGVEGPGRIIRNTVTLFNNENELILLTRQEGGSYVVARSRIEGGTLHAGAPPLPGGPPDGYTAIKRVRVKLDRISARGRSYVTTPPTCPADRMWRNTIRFTYRDGVSQTTASPSPCTPPRADRVAPRIRIRGLPRGCATRSFLARITIRDSSGLRRAGVRLDGRLLRRSSARRLRVRIPARRLRPGWHRLSVIARDRAGNRGKRSVAFCRCAT